MILFINTCVRQQSRTLRLAKCLLERLGDEVEELRLYKIDFPVADEVFLEKRDGLYPHQSSPTGARRASISAATLRCTSFISLCRCGSSLIGQVS